LIYQIRSAFFQAGLLDFLSLLVAKLNFALNFYFSRFVLAPIPQQNVEGAQNRVKFVGSKCKVFF